jgi:DNA end-binding protein Ku
VQDKELKLAMMLIEQTSNETFEPSKYKDTVRERVMEMIQKKIEGQEITSEAPVGSGGDKILDLMEALKASLAKSSKEEIPDIVPKTNGRKQKQLVS